MRRLVYSRSLPRIKPDLSHLLYAHLCRTRYVTTCICLHDVMTVYPIVVAQSLSYYHCAIHR
jgi:hypothetical protein